MNYRIDSFSWKDAIQIIKDRNLSLLLEHDQLSAERNSGRCFAEYDEGVINFDPTYKFRPGTTSYDVGSFDEPAKKKVRTPAWCDRVLWKGGTDRSSNQVQQCSYFACSEFTISDHRPIGAEFVLPFVELLSKQESDSLRKKLFNKIRPSQVAQSNRLHSQYGNESKLLRASDSATIAAAVNLSPKLDYELTIRSDEEGSSMQCVCAIKDEESESQEELDLKVGDLVEVFPDLKIEVHDGWLLGRKVSDGRIGYFRAENVNPLGAMSTKKFDPRVLSKALKATAFRYHRKKVERQNSRRKASLVHKLKRALTEQSRKIFKAKKPSVHYLNVQIYSDMYATGNHVAKESDELTVKKGEIVEVLSLCPICDTDEGWVMCSSVDGDEGLVPRKVLNEHVES